MTAASIRTNNPGAMWGGARARKWGATDDKVLNDGEGNHIAVFPTPVDGAAAQFDLWHSVYIGMSLSSAITKWSGGNSSPTYVSFLTKNAGIQPNEIITSELLSGPRGLALMKAQAEWEAGQRYPMTDEQWSTAQKMAFGQPTEHPSVKHIATGTAGAAAGMALSSLGLPIWACVSAAFVVVAVIYLIARSRSNA